MAASLGLLLVSCSAVRYPAPTGPTGAEDLSRYVLVIEETPDGQVKHSWKPSSGFDLSKYPYQPGSNITGGQVVHAAWTRDCDEEFKQCQEMCLGSLRGTNWKHATKYSKDEICRTRCYPAYRDCCDLRDRVAAEAAEFTAIDGAVDWLKQNREKLLVGTVIVIAGVTFVVVVTGSGGLLLAPALLFASSDVPSTPQFAVSQP
ncbi:hypothetical protein [Archangium lansingense]|uniref:Lipoprotein n=1 Tax=Archangium lansingense TaxID=2995310 RepID=A0ABT4AMJ9_9BACT|nr:hypothetical protein [Archangium lansinium]MCY1082910.1 hypothetical protein [Archangium lansinium]